MIGCHERPKPSQRWQAGSCEREVGNGYYCTPSDMLYAWRAVSVEMACSGVLTFWRFRDGGVDRLALSVVHGDPSGPAWE